MGAGDAVDEGEAEAGALTLLGAAGGAAVEGFEQVREVGRGDAGAAVFDGELDGGAVLRGADGDRFAGAVADGVLDQVAEGDVEGGRVGGEGGVVADGGAGNALAFEGGEHAGEGDGVFGQGDAAGLELAEAEDLVDHGGEAGAFVADQGAVFADLGGVGDVAAGEVVAGRDDDGERRAELVGDAGGELELHGGQALGAAQGVAEGEQGAGEEQERDAADGEVAEAGAVDERAEGAALAAGFQAPDAAAVGGGAEQAALLAEGGELLGEAAAEGAAEEAGGGVAGGGLGGGDDAEGELLEVAVGGVALDEAGEVVVEDAVGVELDGDRAEVAEQGGRVGEDGAVAAAGGGPPGGRFDGDQALGGGVPGLGAPAAVVLGEAEMRSRVTRRARVRRCSSASLTSLIQRYCSQASGSRAASAVPTRMLICRSLSRMSAFLLCPGI